MEDGFNLNHFRMHTSFIRQITKTLSTGNRAKNVIPNNLPPPSELGHSKENIHTGLDPRVDTLFSTILLQRTPDPYIGSSFQYSRDEWTT